MQVAGVKNIRAILFLLKKKGYKVFDKPYELNIVGIRSNNNTPNQFDDLLYVFWKNESGAWVGKYYPITTDPGTYWLKNPMNVDGTAILKEGQYVNAYKTGLHKGQYKALVQSKPITAIRDYDRNAVLDFNNGKETTGLFGINIHRSAISGDSKNVDKWSAGCQVFKNGDDFKDFMSLVAKQEGLYGNNFTYTLIDERSYIRSLRRRAIIFLGIVGIGAALIVGAITINKKNK